MPIYEYVCKKCGTKNEFAESLGSGRIVSKKCGSCGSSRLVKTVSTFAYHPEVTLEDLGVKIERRPMSQMPGETSGITGPPPGGCPYCDSGDGDAQLSEDGNKKP